MSEISKACLHGHPVPRVLQVLWEAHDAQDPFLTEVLRFELLESLDALDDGYSESIADGDEDVLANVRAHRSVFERLGFFARDDDDILYAFDLHSEAKDDPPVVALDSEGQYDWKGENLAEVIVRIAENRELADAARAWLAAHGMEAGELGELGSTTQFLPSIKDYHETLYYQNLGKPREVRPTSAHPAQPRDPFTWLLRPAAEVRAAVGNLLQLPEGSNPPMFCVWCDGSARVINVKIPRRPLTEDIPVHGIKFGMSEAEVSKILGKPDEAGKKINWWAYRLPEGRLWVLFKNDAVVEISVGLNK